MRFILHLLSLFVFFLVFQRIGEAVHLGMQMSMPHPVEPRPFSFT